MQTHTLLDELSVLKTAWQRDLIACTSAADLESLRRAYWGKQGSGTALIAKIAHLEPEVRRHIAPPIQTFARAAQQEIVDTQKLMQQKQVHADRERRANFDVTAPAATPHGKGYGSLHPCTHIMRRIDTILQSMGFAPAYGPEIETAWFNFQALNIGPSHPARDMHDTLWLTQHDTNSGESLLLRTHTSSVQIRTLMHQKPPLAIYAPGRVYRHEATDATHDYVFHQLEILLIDADINMAHLATLLREFMRALFDRPDMQIRLRPSYFPFVEPGLEIDISCIFCTTGCSVCKQSRWIEIGGAGMVHPHTLHSCNIDPQEWAGIAWGLGIERLTMLMYGINDIRIFHQSSVDVLSQWS
jgi:phenylalanyl-tRNA synthetase alpha chain